MEGLEDLYREIILDHYRTPRNRGELPEPAHHVEGVNPLCGDELQLYVLLDGDHVSDVKISGIGCSISQASASLMTTLVKDKTVDEVRELTHEFKRMIGVEEGERNQDVKLGDAEALSGVSKFPVRIKCATLSWNTLAQAIDQPDKASPATTE